jgi:hypothetical protein
MLDNSEYVAVLGKEIEVTGTVSGVEGGRWSSLRRGKKVDGRSGMSAPSWTSPSPMGVHKAE